jgi:hypothetical protein
VGESCGASCNLKEFKWVDRGGEELKLYLGCCMHTQETFASEFMRSRVIQTLLRARLSVSRLSGSRSGSGQLNEKIYTRPFTWSPKNGRLRVAYHDQETFPDRKIQERDKMKSNDIRRPRNSHFQDSKSLASEARGCDSARTTGRYSGSIHYWDGG